MGVDVSSFCIYGFELDDDEPRILESWEDDDEDEEEGDNTLYVSSKILGKYNIRLIQDGYSRWQAVGVDFLEDTPEETIENLKHVKEKLEGFCKEANIDLSGRDVKILEGFYYW